MFTVNDAIRQELCCSAHEVDALLDRRALAPTTEEFSGLGRELQEYLYKPMISMSATNLPSLRGARNDVQGYVDDRGFKVRFETT